MGDSLISGRRYFIFDGNSLRRADKNRLYGFENDREVTLLDYDVQIGDTVDFYGATVIVEEIGQRPIFNLNKTVISVSNKLLNSDTLIAGAYTTQFGLLAFERTRGQHSNGSSLIGATINGIEFGKMF